MPYLYTGYWISYAGSLEYLSNQLERFTRTKHTLTVYHFGGEVGFQLATILNFHYLSRSQISRRNQGDKESVLSF